MEGNIGYTHRGISSGTSWKRRFMHPGREIKVMKARPKKRSKTARKKAALRRKHTKARQRASRGHQKY